MYQWTRDARGVVTTHCPRCPWTYRGSDRAVGREQLAHTRQHDADEAQQ